jgi:ornithine cyclodeaminase/alanine dehydrogenase-like protein (mu-crystallin family)
MVTTTPRSTAALFLTSMLNYDLLVKLLAAKPGVYKVNRQRMDQHCDAPESLVFETKDGIEEIGVSEEMLNHNTHEELSQIIHEYLIGDVT